MEGLLSSYTYIHTHINIQTKLIICTYIQALLESHVLPIDETQKKMKRIAPSNCSIREREEIVSSSSGTGLLSSYTYIHTHINIQTKIIIYTYMQLVVETKNILFSIRTFLDLAIYIYSLLTNHKRKWNAFLQFVKGNCMKRLQKLSDRVSVQLYVHIYVHSYT